MYRSSEQMYPIVEEYIQGGRSKEALCKANGFSIHVFQYWLKKYQDTKTEIVDNFSALEITQSESLGHINIHLPNGARIEIPMR